MPAQQDTQAQLISAGLSTLQELLETPVAKNALELGKNAEAAKHYTILKRLSKSLMQYLERDGALFYVGLIGHFSAGKSSTINSLLATWQTEFERKTDFHPTDKTITLITRERNADSLLGVIREGHVPIRLQKVESEVLNQIVLVDTPGTGDPEFFEEVARDFLPICDVILFVFSAANPLDASDVPLLKELHSRLPFIPLHFVVTRTDELRVDLNKPLSNDNFDTSKAQHFLDSATSRVNILLSPQVYQTSNFTLIDNKTKFNIDKLESFIGHKCDISSPQAHVSMHMNKLQFYLNGARQLRDFFAGVLDHKLDEVSKIVDAAARNIQRYQEIVQISNSNLTKMWAESAAAINQASTTAANVLKTTLLLPADFDWLQTVNSRRIGIGNEMSRDAQSASKTISLAIKSTITTALREEIYKLETKLNDTSIPELNGSQQKLENPPFPLEIGTNNLLSASTLIRRYNEMRDTEAGALRDAATDQRRMIKDLEDLINQRAQLNESSSVIGTARESLKADLNKFFQNVELYRTGVFSHTTKESIATLGIGGQLDQLENEFTGEDKERFARDADLQLFPNVDQVATNAGSKLLSEAEKVRPLAERERGLRLDRPDTPEQNIKQALNAAYGGLETNLEEKVRLDVAEFGSQFNTSLSSIIIDAKTRYDTRIRSFKSDRRRVYALSCALSGLLWLLATIAWRHREHAAPKSTVGEIILGIAAGAILQIVTVLFVKWWKSLPKVMNRASEDSHELLNKELQNLKQRMLTEHKFSSIEEAPLAQSINQIYIQTLSVSNSPWRGTAMTFLSDMRQLQTEFAVQRQEHLKTVEELRLSSSRYFTDQALNLSLLTGIAANIKESAIEPSFDLLETTKEELLTVKQRVTGVSFV